MTVFSLILLTDLLDCQRSILKFVQERKLSEYEINHYLDAHSEEMFINLHRCSNAEVKIIIAFTES